VKDSSDMVFTISEAHSITVLHPNGGGLMETNSSDSITWAWTGLFDYVDIYYSHNGGSNWYLIEELVVNNGFYNWSPTFASTNFLIKVEESGNSSIYDISDQVFEVGPTGTIDLLYPDGGEIFLGATLDSVLWDANGNVNFNDVKFSSDGGATWSWEGDAPAEWESVGWAIPNISSTTCLIAYGGDTSSTYFTIVENLDSIMVLSPNGGEVYEGGDTLIVTWDTTGNSNAPLIDFYFKLTYNFQLRATVPNTGSMEYVLPNVTTTTAEVRLQLNGTTIYDDSDGPFSVTEIAISVVSPNGGEVLTGNDSTVISWTQTGTFDGVKLSYTPDLGSHWVDIAESVSGNSYMWTIPNISSANCMVKVARVGVIADQSNAVFTINNVPLPPWDSIAMINVDDLQYHQWLSENIGFYCADQYPGGVFSYPFHTIQKTLNGGQTWTTTNPITTSYQGLPLAIYGTWFFDANNGIAMGHPMQWASHDWETWITSDAGVTWTQRSDTVFADFSTYSDFGMKDFEMLDVNVGYANARIYNITLGTLQDVIFLTTDGGLTWNVRPTPDLTFHHGGEFLNASTGFVVGNDYVYKTIDGGVSWTNSYQVQGNGVPKDLDFVSDSVGYVMTRLLNGSWFNIIRTTDQGLTWDVRNVPPISYTDVGEMFFLSQDVGLISSTANPGVSGIWRTSNGALTWETDSLVSTVPVQKSDKAVDIVMVSETINYALLSGMIIKAGAVPPASSYNNTWTYSNTGNSHTILIPNSAPVTIDGTQLAIGDFIGVFYDSLGNQACAGFMEWTAQIQSITAWGDDPLTSEPDGFATGETFQWKVWRAIDGLGFDATATYIQPPTMPNTGTFVTNGMSGLISLDAIIEEYQSIDLPQGWSIFSSYINPFEANFDSICAPIITEVIIAKDADGQVYWPQWNVNLIGDLLIGDGYQIKLVTMQTMTLVGNAVQPENTLVTIDQGWSIMGYLRQSEAPINIMLSPVVSEIIIVKNGAGQIYWPQWGVNLIGNMVPGEGYQVNMITQQSLLFPANSILFTKFVMNQFQSVHFNTNKNTGNNMSLGLMTSEFKIGSEIGVFSQSGLLVGSGVVTGNFTALTLWGDDETTPEIDGLHRGEEFIIKLWNGEECILEHNSWLQGDGTYKKNDIAIPDKLDVVADNFITLISYPNPFKDVTTIEFTIPADGYVVIKLYNSTGMLLEVISDRAYPAGKHEVQLNVGDVSVGNYFIRLESNGQAINNAIQIVK
jgi:hypothetical protein